MRTPKLSLHARGVYFVKHKGKNHYFTKDRKESEARYLSWLNSVWLPAQEGKQTTDSKPMTVLDLAELYLIWVYQNRSKKLFQDYRAYLRPLIGMTPTISPSEVDTQFCEALKQDMLSSGYKPTTVNHTLKGIRRMLSWGLQHGMLPSAPQLASISARVVQVRTESLTRRQVQGLLEHTLQQSQTPTLLAYLVLNYLTCARPSEIVRLAHGDGEWVERNVFRTRSKVGNRTGYDRFLLFSDEALTWVPKLEPRWSTHDSYGKAVRKLGMGGPRQLRTAGASHLRAAGVSYKDIRVILGHTEAGAVVHYVEEDFSTVLPYLSRLSVLPLRPD